MANFYHLEVRFKKLGMHLQIKCLCLNGSAHAVMATNKAAVTCPACMKIMSLMDGGMGMEEARTKVIDEILEEARVKREGEQA